MNSHSTTARLSVIESAGLIELAASRPELEYAFRHMLVKEAAYASLVRGDRRSLHHVVAQTLERLYLAEVDRAPSGPRPPRGELLPLLGLHYAEAGEVEPAARYFTQAGDLAARVYANGEAIAHYSQAITLLRPNPREQARLVYLYTRRGRAQEVTGQQPAALENYLELEALGRERAQPALVLAGLSLRAALLAIPSLVTDVTQARELAQSALRQARELGDQVVEARMLWTLMLVETFYSRPTRAVAYGQQALALARTLDQPELVALILNDLGRAYLNSGQATAAQAAEEEARQLWEAEGNLAMLADTVSNLASSYFFTGDYDAALANLKESQTLARAIGDAWGQAYSLMLQALLHLEQGRVDDAFAYADECLRLSALAGFLYAQIIVPANLALAYSLLGAPARGLKVAEEALALAEAKAPELRSEVTAVLAQIYCDLGDWARSNAYLQQAQAGARPEDQLAFAPVIAASAEGNLALAVGDLERAIRVARETAANLETIGLKAFLAHILIPGVRALRRLGRNDEAAALLATAQAALDQQTSRWGQWLVLAEKAALADQRGEAEAARAQRAAARLTIDFIVAHVSEAGLRDSFLRRPDVQAVLAG